MKAAVRTRYGPPEVVRILDIDQPAVKDDEVLVKVHATTVNRTDCGFRAGRPFIVRFFAGLRRPTATVLGNEFAGVVEAVGDTVTMWKVGEPVFGYHDGTFGAHAQYLAVPEAASLAAIPAGMAFDEAAACTEGSHYALSLITAAKVDVGQDVLVYGATGAIGSAAVQLLKAAGARVTAVCDTARVHLVRELGADRVVDYTAEDFTKDGQLYDVVLDAVGKTTFGRCRCLLKRRGIYLSTDLGPGAQNLVLALVTPLLRSRRVLFPIPRHDQAIVRHLGALMASGAFRPVIDRQYRLDQIVEAYRYVETGNKTGNVVITVDKSNQVSSSPPR